MSVVPSGITPAIVRSTVRVASVKLSLAANFLSMQRRIAPMVNSSNTLIICIDGWVASGSVEQVCMGSKEGVGDGEVDVDGEGVVIVNWSVMVKVLVMAKVLVTALGVAMAVRVMMTVGVLTVVGLYVLFLVVTLYWA